jgi:hypothetical protein
MICISSFDSFGADGMPSPTGVLVLLHLSSAVKRNRRGPGSSRNRISGSAEPLEDDGKLACLNHGCSHKAPFALAWYPRKEMPDYPGFAQSTDASPIPVTRGATTNGIEFSLLAVSAYQVSGVVV